MFQSKSASSLLPVTMCVVVVVLLLFGITGIQRGDELELSGEFARKQVLWTVLGVALLVAAMAIPYRGLREWGYPLFAVSLVLLLAVYLFPPRNGSRRWIPVGPIFLQPSELAKLAYLLALGRYLMYRKNQRTVLGLIPPFLMTVVPVLLILREPDLGTSLLFFPALFAVLYSAGARTSHLVVTIVAGTMMLPVLWTAMSAEQKSRVTALFTQEDGGSPKTGDGYHLHQSKQVLALGGPLGSEFGRPPVEDLAAYRLPAGRTDFVYCLIGERWGVAGTVGVLLMFGVLTVAGLAVAGRTRDPFGRLLATGIITMLGFQGLINMAMTVGLAPITGLTLPLVSYGGSSLVMTCLSIGLVINIALHPGYDVAGQPFRYEQ